MYSTCDPYISFSCKSRSTLRVSSSLHQTASTTLLRGDRSLCVGLQVRDNNSTSVLSMSRKSPSVNVHPSVGCVIARPSELPYSSSWGYPVSHWGRGSIAREPSSSRTRWDEICPRVSVHYSCDWHRNSLWRNRDSGSVFVWENGFCVRGWRCGRYQCVP